MAIRPFQPNTVSPPGPGARAYPNVDMNAPAAGSTGAPPPPAMEPPVAPGAEPPGVGLDPQVEQGARNPVITALNTLAVFATSLRDQQHPAADQVMDSLSNLLQNLAGAGEQGPLPPPGPEAGPGMTPPGPETAPPMPGPEMAPPGPETAPPGPEAPMPGPGMTPPPGMEGGSMEKKKMPNIRQFGEPGKGSRPAAENKGQRKLPVIL